MTPIEKIYNSVKEWFIVTEGIKFLQLSEKDQNLLIWGKVKDYFESLNN